MKQLRFKQLLLAAAVCGSSVVAFAQDTKDKTIKKEVKEKQQIIITRSGDKEEKMVVEIDGNKVKVNGKDVTDLENINVHISNLKMPTINWSPAGQNGNIHINGNGSYFFNDDDNNFSSIYSVDSSRAMLGVNTEQADGGVRLSSVVKGSAAEKAGLKKGDILTKIDSRNIQATGDITDAIHTHKPGDKVTVTFLRDGKEQKATASLDRWKGIDVAGMPTPAQWDTQAWGNMRYDRALTDRLTGTARARSAFSAFGASRPKMGMSVQDTDDGKGVKVLNTDDDGNAAKAGVKEGDIILQIDDKAVNSADELATQLKEKKDQPAVKLQVQRDGKTQTIEVRIPKKLKTVDL